MRALVTFCLVVACLVSFGSSPAQAAQMERSLVKVETGMGDFIIELYPDKAPKTVANFLQYVKDSAYDGTIFHRVMSGFMIQGGGFTPDMRPVANTRPPIRNEADNGLKNERYTVAMARTSDPHSATNQFFINVVDNKFLNFTAPAGQGWGYCVFGKVVDGMDTVDKIRAVPTTTKGMHENVPITPVIIRKISVFKLK